MRPFSIQGSRGECTVEKTADGRYRLTAEIRVDDDRGAQKLALAVAHKSLAPAALAGWEVDADSLRFVEGQIADAVAADDAELARTIQLAALETAMREISEGHPFPRDVAAACNHLMARKPLDLTGSEVADFFSRSHRRSA